MQTTSLEKQIKLVLICEDGNTSSLTFLDHMLYYAYFIRKIGITVSFSRNVLCKCSINFLFNAHNLKNYEILEEYLYVIINLEQMQSPPMIANKNYLHLLRNSIVIDYSKSNIGFYSEKESQGRLIEFGYAPYLPPQDLSESRIQSGIFYGSMSERRKVIITKFNELGMSVDVLSPPLFGPERDLLLIKYGFVLNIPYYSKPIFEQTRVFHPMSMGIPVIAEISQYDEIPSIYRDTVLWFEIDDIHTLSELIKKPELFKRSTDEKVNKFKSQYIERDHVERWSNQINLIHNDLKSKGRTRSHQASVKVDSRKQPESNHATTYFIDSLTESFLALCDVLTINAKIHLVCSCRALFTEWTGNIENRPVRFIFFSTNNNYLVEVKMENQFESVSSIKANYPVTNSPQLFSVKKYASTIYEKNLLRTYTHDLGLVPPERVNLF